MRLVAILFVAMCAAGCGGTLVLKSDHGGSHPPAPAPRTAPPEACPPNEIGRQAAVAIVENHASQDRIRHTSVRKVERHKRHWDVRLRGTNRERRSVEIRAKVDRWSGEMLSYKTRTERDHDGHHDDD